MTIVPLSCLLALGAYLLGSVPWGIVLTRRVAAVDIRQQGSGNIGATNVARVAGKTLGALTLAADVLKGAVPVGLARWLLAGNGSGFADAVVAIVGLAAFGGHLYPVFLKFKTGGKGVATAGGAFLVMAPGAFAASLAVFCLVFWRFRFVSAASLAAVTVLPAGAALCGNSLFTILAALVTAGFVFLRHRDNIRRLLNGSEPVFGKSLKK